MSANIEQAPVDVAKTPQVIIYGHSWLFYWWPVWVLGYVMALLTWLHPGPTHHRFSRIPSPRRISSRKLGSRAAAKRF